MNAKEEENKKQSLLSNLGTGLLLTNSLSQSEVVGASTTGSEDLTGSTTGKILDIRIKTFFLFLSFNQTFSTS